METIDRSMGENNNAIRSFDRVFYTGYYYRICEADNSTPEIKNFLNTYGAKIKNYQLTNIESKTQLEELAEEENVERFTTLVNNCFPAQILSITYTDRDLEAVILELGWKKICY